MACAKDVQPNLWTKSGDSEKGSLISGKPKIEGSKKEILHTSGLISAIVCFKKQITVLNSCNK